MNRKQISRSECIHHLQKILPELEDKYSVNYLGLFGSAARDSMRNFSDVDILISFDKSPSLFTLTDIERWIKRELKCKVDLIIKDAISQEFFDRIKNDLIQID